jgi:hypothetical protein
MADRISLFSRLTRREEHLAANGQPDDDGDTYRDCRAVPAVGHTRAGLVADLKRGTAGEVSRRP